jgi:hypothetical protein
VGKEEGGRQKAEEGRLKALEERVPALENWRQNEEAYAIETPVD